MLKRQEITKETARQLKNATGDSAGNRSVQDFLRYSRESDPQSMMAAVDLERANADSVRELNRSGRPYTGTQKANDEALIIERYNQDLAEQIRLLKEGAITQKEADNLSNQAAIRQNNNLLQLKSHLTEIQELQRATAQMFASGFSAAFVDFVSGTKDAKEAFSDFSRSFLSQITQMIAQQMILKAIKSTSWGSALFSAEGGMYPRFMADGGMQGVSMVSSATYFPRFNVVAGEAGAEMMTVLARPRMMEVGGMQAGVGSAQGNRLAITNADALAQSGGGGINGQAQIVVTLGPELRAEIVQQSIKGARVQVAQDMRADTDISRGVKGLTA
ncbi:MAG: phage tail tape measure C-terminal domain-containing protein [Verrucomicrobiota bacterium]